MPRDKSIPTKTQRLWLHRIDLAGGVFVTRKEGENDKFTTASGREVGYGVCQNAIRWGWLIGKGDSLFNDDSQSYAVNMGAL